jgi:hypothetical protein
MASSTVVSWGHDVAMMLSPTESGSTFFSFKALMRAARRLVTDKVLTLGAWIVNHSSVLRDNAGEQVEIVVSEIAQFASGHQDRSPPRLLQALERVVS